MSCNATVRPIHEMFPKRFKWSDLYSKEAKEIAEEHFRYIEEIRFLMVYTDLMNAIRNNDFNREKIARGTI